MNTIQDSDEYAAIQAYYGSRTAERSGVPLMNHIDQGILILKHLKANDATQRAFCLHPLFQHDDQLQKEGLNYVNHHWHDPYTVMLAMEYRTQANAFLSDKVKLNYLVNSAGKKVPDTAWLDVEGSPSSGPLKEVRLMLIADKVQNYKDFLAHHMSKHGRSGELLQYFHLWFATLDISSALYAELCAVINQ